MQSEESDAITAFPMVRDNPMLPPNKYGEIARGKGLQKIRLWDGSTAWLATKAAYVRAILMDQRFSADGRRPGYPTAAQAKRSLLSNERQHITQLEGENHVRLRTMIMKELGGAKSEGLRPRIAEIGIELAQRFPLDGTEFDFITRFARPFAVQSTGLFLGIPEEDSDFFAKVLDDRVRLNVDPSVPIAAGRALEEYFRDLIKKKEEEKTSDDFISRIFSNYISNGILGYDEGLHLISNQLIQASIEGTANALSLGMLLLVKNPDQALLLAHDDGKVGGVVEEILRYSTVTQFSIARVALEDVSIGDECIRAGEGVFASLLGANHDPDNYDCPAAFDVQRKKGRNFVFSYGAHQCAGQQLARIELQEALKALAPILPRMRLAGPETAIVFKSESSVYGIERLPLRISGSGNEPRSRDGSLPEEA